MKHFLLCLFFYTFPFLASAQTSTGIEGKLTDSSSNPIAGATIAIKGTQKKTFTDSWGGFNLPLLPGQYILIISHVGFTSSQHKLIIPAGEILKVELKLKSDHQELDLAQVNAKSGIQKVRETPFNVVALDAKSQYNTTLNLSNLLDKASGVKIRETGGVGSDMNITLNGFTGRHVKVFMDGVPMQGFGSSFQLNNIPVSVAERIEVYKGVVPIEFGADALGGVINIVTNQTTNSFLDASYSYGSFNTHRTNIAVGKTFKSGISLQLNAFQNYSDNNYKVNTSTFDFIPGTSSAIMSSDKYWVRRFHDSYKNETVIAKVGVVGKRWADRLYFGVTLAQVKKDIQNQADMRFAFGERTAYTQSLLPSFSYDKRNLFVKGLSVRLTGNYNFQRGGSVDTSAFRYNWFGEKQLRRAKGEAGNSVLSDYTNSNQSANGNVSYQINDQHSFSLNDVVSGYTRKPVIDEIAVEERDASDSMLRTSFKNVLGLSYRFSYKRKWNTNLFAKHYLNKAGGPFTGVTASRNNDSIYKRNESAGKAGYGVATTYFFKEFQLKLSIEKAYRLPTDQELFGDEIMETGNVALRPENSMNYNLGVTFNKEISKNYTLYIDVSAYYRDTKDFIRRTLQANSQSQSYTFGNANHGHVTNLGVDLEIRTYYKNKATLGGTFTWMNLRDKEPWQNAIAGGNKNPSYGERMPNQPYIFGNLDAGYYFHDLFGKGNVLSINYTMNYMHSFFLNAPNFGYLDSKDVIPDQLYSDFSATYIIKNGRYNFTFEARNIENAFLYDNFSLQKPGRNFAGKVRYYLINRKKKSTNNNQK